MEKIFNQIKKLIFRIIPNNRELNGSEFNRGRQSLAIEIADLIDPISIENVKPDNDVNDGEVLFKETIPAKAIALGWGNIVLGFEKNGFISYFKDILWDEKQHKNVDYEITVKKIGRIKEEKKDDGDKPKFRRRGANNENKEFELAREQIEKMARMGFDGEMQFVQMEPVREDNAQQAGGGLWYNIV